MTVMAIPEAVGAGEAAGARVIQGRATTVSERRVRRPRPSQATRRAKQGARQYGAQAAYVGQNANLTPGNRSYQPVILAEFLIAVVIVALVPVASGGSPNAKAKGSPSPYDVGDLRQLVAVGAVYFVLSLISSGNRGRISAWLGGLIVIGLLITKLSAGQLGQVFSTLSGAQPSTGGGGGGKSEPA